MKAHFGVDSRSKLIHAVQTTPAHVADSTVLPDLLHGNETRVWGDQAYRGQRAVIRQHAPQARDFVNRRYRHRGVVDEAEGPLASAARIKVSGILQRFSAELVAASFVRNHRGIGHPAGNQNIYGNAFEQFHARLCANNATRLSTIEWLWAAKRA